MKKFYSSVWVLLVVMVVGFSGCGKSSTPTKQTLESTVASGASELQEALATVKEKVAAGDFAGAKAAADAAVKANPQDKTALLYQKQLQELIAFQAADTAGDLTAAKEASETLSAIEKLLPEVKDHAALAATKLAEVQNLIQTSQQSLSSAQSASENGEFQASNDLLAPVLALEKTPYLAATITTAEELKQKNDAAILQQALILTQAEAESIIKENLPDYFASDTFQWVTLPMDNEEGWRFSIISTGSFRGNAYMVVKDQDTVTVTFEKGSSTSPDSTPEVYEFKRN